MWHFNCKGEKWLLVRINQSIQYWFAPQKEQHRLYSSYQERDKEKTNITRWWFNTHRVFYHFQRSRLFCFKKWTGIAFIMFMKDENFPVHWHFSKENTEWITFNVGWKFNMNYFVIGNLNTFHIYVKINWPFVYHVYSTDSTEHAEQWREVYTCHLLHYLDSSVLDIYDLVMIIYS